MKTIHQLKENQEPMARSKRLLLTFADRKQLPNWHKNLSRQATAEISSHTEILTYRGTTHWGINE